MRSSGTGWRNPPTEVRRLTPWLTVLAFAGFVLLLIDALGRLDYREIVMAAAGVILAWRLLVRGL
jgi:hypothetical protein